MSFEEALTEILLDLTRHTASQHKYAVKIVLTVKVPKLYILNIYL